MDKRRIYHYIMAGLLVFAIGGIFGFVYEELFYRIELGRFVKRGTTLGPWIPIYGFGALLITASTYRFRRSKWLVVLIGGAVCGILEFITGYLLYHISDLRLWDYNEEMMNWGNINGYICIRSVAFFAVSSLLLVYAIIPFILYMERRLSKPLYAVVSIIPGALFLTDFLAVDVLKVI